MRYVWLAGAILFLAMLCTPAMGEEPCACSDAIGQWDTTRILMENGQPNAIEQLNPIQEKMEIKEAGFCKLTGSFGNGGTITGTFLANSLQSGTDTNFGGEWSLGGKSGDANLKFYCEPGKGVTKFSGDMILKEENTRTEWRWEGKKAGTGCEDKSSENLVLVPGSTPPNCEWVCKDGYGRTSEDIVCRPCADICKSRNKNEIPDPAGSVGGKCECIPGSTGGPKLSVETPEGIKKPGIGEKIQVTLKPGQSVKTKAECEDMKAGLEFLALTFKDISEYAENTEYNKKFAEATEKFGDLRSQEYHYKALNERWVNGGPISQEEREFMAAYTEYEKWEKEFVNPTTLTACLLLMYLQSYRNLCPGAENPSLYDISSYDVAPSASAAVSPVEIEIELQEGGFTAEITDDRVSLNIEMPTMRVSSQGKNTFGVAYDPASGKSYVAAYQHPVQIKPTNSNQAPFALESGQMVEISAAEVGPTVPIATISGEETSELQGSAPEGMPEITQGGCYTDPETGETTCIDSTKEPSDSKEVSTGSTKQPSNSQPQGQPGTTEAALSGNSALGESAEISSGQSVNQAISPAGSSNWYKVKADSNGIISVKVTDAPKDMRAQVKLYDKNFVLFEDKLATSAGDDLKFERDVPVPGWIYMAVYDADGKAHAEPYTLTADFQPVQDSFDPNNVLGDAAEIQLGQAVTASICPKGEWDWYKIKVGSNAILSVSIVDAPEDMRSQIKLYDKNFALFEEKLATSAGDDLKFERDVPVPGWIYLAVFDAEGKAYAEPYTLTVA